MSDAPETNQETATEPVVKTRRRVRRPFRLRRRRSSREEEPLAEAKKPAGWKAPFRFLGRLRRKVSLKMLLFRTVVYGVSGFFLLLFAAWAIIATTVEPEDVRRAVKQLVEEQTGGRLDIGSVEFNVLTGIELRNVQFYPPMTDDTRGYLNGGEVNPLPLANFDALLVEYSIPRLFAGRLHLKALKLVEPQFHLRQSDGIFNFDAILAYRAEHFPPQEEFPEATPAEDGEETERKPSRSILPVSPAWLYLPIDIMAADIGIENLKLDMVVEEKGQIAQVLVTSGLTFKLGLTWSGANSAVWFSLVSPFEKPFELDIRDGERNPDGELTGNLAQTLLVRTALIQRFEIRDFRHLSLDLALRVLKLETPFAGYEDLGTFVKARLSLNQDLDGIDVETIEVDLADALRYRLKGAIRVPDDSFQAFNLSLDQTMTISLADAAAMAKPFVPTLKAGGAIDFETLKVEGLLDLSHLADPTKGSSLPFLTSVLWLEDVFVDYPETGVSMAPIAGSISVAAGPSLTGKGSQIDAAVDLTMPRVSAKQATALGDVEITVEDLLAKVTARVLWPEMIAPVLKVNVEAEHVRTAGKGIAEVDVPLFIDVDADGRQDMKRLGLSASLELSDLAEFSVMADCQDACAKFRSNALVRLDSLHNLHSIAMPLSGFLGAGAYMPTRLDGAIDLQFAARGAIPNPMELPPDQVAARVVRDGKVRFNGQFNVTKLSADVPAFKTALRDLNVRLLASGNLEKQKVDLSQSFESVSLTLPSGPGEPKGKDVKLERFSFDATVENEADGPLDLNGDPARQLSTSVGTKTYLGRVTAPELLPLPLSDLQVNVKAKQTKLADIKLEDLWVRVPDLGTRVTLAADTRLGAEMLPLFAKAKVKAEIAHTGNEKLPAGVSSTGHIVVDLGFEAKDLAGIIQRAGGAGAPGPKIVALDGEARFEDFALRVPGEKPDEPLLQVAGVSGQIPFKQAVDLEPFLVALHAPRGQGQVATSATAADGSEVDALLALDQGSTQGPALDEAVSQYFDKNEDKLLQSTNVVALVDYPTVRPFYPERRPLAIERLEVANLELSKMEFDIELRQNWFAVNQFVINFLGGKIQGDFQLAFDPMPKSVRTSVHMTQLDTRKLIERFPNLKGRASGWNLFSDPFIGGTVHFKYDLRNRDMQGNVEIRPIGKEQLRMILLYVDPYEKDPTIAKIRQALAFGDVRQVSIPIKNGLLGLDVDVRTVLGVPIPLPGVSDIPVGQIVQNYIEQIGASGASEPVESTAPGPEVAAEPEQSGV